MTTTAVVIGYGSIGRRHALALAARSVRLVIVNRRASVRELAAAAHPEALVVDRLEALDPVINWARSAAVIATWGPSHAELFHALVDRGVSRILCEKPMAASVRDAEGMAERAGREALFVAMSHTLRYAGLAAAVRRLSVEHGLGEPVSVVVQGGAACLLTNGIHWLDFAIELFGTTPERVVSTATGDPINPRSPDLRMYGGTAVWSFPGGREAVIALTNRSSVVHGASIYFRDAVLTAGYVSVGDDARLLVGAYRREPEAVARFAAVTRTGPASESIQDGELPGVRRFNAGLTAAADELLEGRAPTCSAAAGATATTACIGALVAARCGRAVTLPPDPSAQWRDQEWPIS
jgi:predicted dehydrogenase